MSYNNGPKIVTNGLVLYLDAANSRSFTSGSTVWRDLSRNDNSGSLINGPVYSSNNNGYITCDGTNDYIEVTGKNNMVFGSGSFSVEYWFRKLSATTGGFYDNIWGPNMWNTGASPGTNNWSLAIGNGSTGTGENLQISIEASSTAYTITTTQTISLNLWYQLTGIRSGNLLQLYLNGELLLSSTPVGCTASTIMNNIAGRNLRINNSGLDNLYTNADNAILRIYNRALSASEVRQNYHASKGRFGL